METTVATATAATQGFLAKHWGKILIALILIGLAIWYFFFYNKGLSGTDGNACTYSSNTRKVGDFAAAPAIAPEVITANVSGISIGGQCASPSFDSNGVRYSFKNSKYYKSVAGTETEISKSTFVSEYKKKLGL